MRYLPDGGRCLHALRLARPSLRCGAARQLTEESSPDDWHSHARSLGHLDVHVTGRVSLDHP